MEINKEEKIPEENEIDNPGLKEPPPPYSQDNESANWYEEQQQPQPGQQVKNLHAICYRC